MAKRSSLNRRSSKSSRYSDSAVLNPDTDVVDNTYPYWSKNLENNTIARLSTDYNMFSETSRQLDSNSQVELSEAEAEWWKVFDNFSSSEDNANNIEQSAAKFTIVTSESEEEPRIKKRKLSLLSKARTHKNNAFFNVLHDSEGTSANSSGQKVRGKSSINNSESKNKEMTNKEQLAEMHDSSSNQSSNLNNIVKSKPRIFKKDYNNQNNIFIDVLQNSEFKVPSSSKFSITKSPKPVERKDSSIMQTPLDNQSESNEYTLSSGSVPDFSHFPVPKAQSTAFEDSTPCSSSKNDSSSDIEPKIMKQKPKLLKRRSRSIKKNVYKNIFIAEESNEETKGNVLASKNIVENTEIPQRFSTSSSTDSHKISHKSQKNVINEDENKGTEISSSRKKRKSAILAERNIKDCIEKDILGKKVTTNDLSDDSIKSSIIPRQPSISLAQEKGGSKSLSSLGNNTKQKNAQGRSTLDQSIINGKNVTEVHKDVAKDYNDELQVDNTQKNISLTRSAVHTLLSFEEGNRDNAKNRSRLSHITSNSTSSIKRNKSLRSKGREIEEEISKDSRDEEIMDKYVDDRKMKKRSVPKDLSGFSKKQPDTVKDSKRSSSRNGNLTSSVNRIQDIGSNTSNVNDKYVRSQNLNSISSEETINQSKYIEKSTTALDRKSANVLSSSNGKQHNNIDTNSLNVDKNVREVENEVSSDSSDQNLASRFRRISQRRSVANVSSSINRKEDSNAGGRGRVSSRVSNLVLSAKEGTQKNTHAASVAGEDARKIEGVLQAIGNEETPKTSRHTDTDHRSTSQRKSNSSNTSRKERGTAENRRRTSTRISNLALSTNKIEDVDSKTTGVNDENAKEIEKEFSSDSDYDMLIHRPDPLYERTAANISSSINREERSVKEKQRKPLRIISDVMLSTKELIPAHGILSDVDKKNEKERKRKVQVSQAAGNEETPKQRSVSQKKSVSLNHSAKERSNEKNLGRGSSRDSNLVLSTKENTRMNRNSSNIRDEDKIEAVEEASNDSANEEDPNELQQPDKNTDTFQRESGANVSSALNKEKQDNVQNLRKVSSRISLSFLKTPTNKDKSKLKGQMGIKNFLTNIAVDEEKVKMIKERLENVKKQEMEKMNAKLKQGEVKSSETKNIIKRKKSVKPKEKQVHKAYLVNGVVYKVPRLPRPKSWVTNRLYDHLWKVMEPKYNLNTRVISEKFVRQMCGITTIIAKQKSYERYKDELEALMKEMARLGIIRTRNEFYHFCHEFLPYELVEKMVPMLLPGNKKNMPFDPNTLYEPLLGS
nr:GATA zinc finger domain-containing protein 14-like [Osmia lignaria]